MKNTKLKCILIDDSTLQRRAVAKIIKEHSKLELINEFDNGLDAKNDIGSNIIDLIFLDIEMPGFNGFDLLESLEHKPQVILISGNPNYAMKAFDYDVTDYLQKPVDKNRFDLSIKKAINKFDLQNAEEVELEYIYVNSNLKKTKLFLNEIMWIEAYGDYVKIITNEKKTLILSTMKAFAKQLPQNKFLRIHKSYTVNLEKIENFNGSTVEINGQVIPLSRHKKEALIEALVVIE
ncbi:LytTR family DNA-binding domain-containing protein [Arenibacter sp. F26102]|uniref:LytR/AlgR family response regulator transcription factor n=1 Tax=Arenibacter sp. F26102 TaxID=2926416 RepID=UPI001FF17769|nr:LytTR family DNA-binding domain-containing protein [Arenibacter sp. F26102]MCK0145921.1 LytTR family DNA-binding domain-containing protein [Arenibacter sp. F26102]